MNPMSTALNHSSGTIHSSSTVNGYGPYPWIALRKESLASLSANTPRLNRPFKGLADVLLSLDWDEIDNSVFQMTIRQTRNAITANSSDYSERSPKLQQRRLFINISAEIDGIPNQFTLASRTAIR